MFVAALLVLVVSLLGVRRIVNGRRLEMEQQILSHRARARAAAARASSGETDARGFRTKAFARFEANDRQAGEALWKQTLSLIQSIESEYEDGDRNLEAARALDPSRADIRNELADLRLAHLLFAKSFEPAVRAEPLRGRLAAVDADHSRRARLDAPGKLAIETRPTAARAVLEHYLVDPASGRRQPRTVGEPNPAALALTLKPGSYRLILDGPGLANVVYPFEIRADETTTRSLSIPSASSVPAGFVFVPPGTTYFGSDDEELRTSFLDTTPIHRSSIGAFLIARHETTFGDWIKYLEAIPATEAARHLPNGLEPGGGSIRLTRDRGRWRLNVKPYSVSFTAVAGEDVRYAGRETSQRQDWLRMPVTGITVKDAEAYASWYRASTGVAARLCSEREWERAARGADDREYPHGDVLAPGDANIDITYGRNPALFGLDEVGSHPASRSPFAVDDLAGNANEFTTSAFDPGAYVIRGGSYYQDANTARSSNRGLITDSLRAAAVGVRLCADLE